MQEVDDLTVANAVDEVSQRPAEDEAQREGRQAIPGLPAKIGPPAKISASGYPGGIGPTQSHRTIASVTGEVESKHMAFRDSPRHSTFTINLSFTFQLRAICP